MSSTSPISPRKIAAHVAGEDPRASPLGGKGVGEIGIVGFAPAIADAVFDAAGRRVRSLPITPDKML